MCVTMSVTAAGLDLTGGAEDVLDALARARRVINPVTGIVNLLRRQPGYNDEPKFFHYLARLCNTSLFSDGGRVEQYAGGLSLVKDRAILKALAEAIERYCLSIYRESNLIRGSFRSLGDAALDPKEVVNWSESQLLTGKLSSIRFTDDAKLNWVQGYSLTEDRPILVPAQLVYVPYARGREPLLRLPITTGAASGTSLPGAIYRGICEVIERDAFMITYLNRLERSQVTGAHTDDAVLATMYRAFDRYHLEVRVMYITTEIPVPVFLSVIVDRSGIGPAVSLGLKASLHPIEAIIGSMEEALSCRRWVRDLMLERADASLSDRGGGGISSLEDRALLWSDTCMIRHLGFLLENGSCKALQDIPSTASDSAAASQVQVLSMLAQRAMQVVFVDVTTPDVEEIGFKVVKVVIPELQPLYLDEARRYLGGDRLYSVPKLLGYREARTNQAQLNPIPHPFL